MSHDLIIRGGTIVDGTGAAGYSGDVAIDGDTITALGEVSGKGIREIDASVEPKALSSLISPDLWLDRILP